MPELEEMSVEELIATAAFDREAQFQIGKHYFKGTGGVERDYFKAVGWIQSAADRGCSQAQYFLGCCYLHGRGVSIDVSQALKWFKKAADNECFEALVYLDSFRDAGLRCPQG